LKRRKRTYEPIFATCLAAALAESKNQIPKAETARLCNRLERLRPTQVDLWLRNTNSFCRLEVAAELISRCGRFLQHEEPAASIRRASVALAVADRHESGPSSLAHDFAAEALSWIANAQRRLELFRDAEQTWTLAFARLRTGSQDPLLYHRLVVRRSSLSIDIGNYDQALADLRTAESVISVLSDPHEAARVQLKLGKAASYSGRADQSFRAFSCALRHLDKDRDPDLRLLAMEGSIVALTDLGRVWLAHGLSDAAEPFFTELGGEPQVRRFRWLRGRLLAINGYLHDARTYLEPVRLELIEAGQLVDASICTLDLASVYAGLRKPDTQRALAEEMLPLFHSAGLEREALAAVLLYVDAARNYRANRDLMKSVLAKIDPFRKPKPKGRLDSAEKG
jgi:tetratricopeptide (TPR) repeat protein